MMMTGLEITSQLYGRFRCSSYFQARFVLNRRERMLFMYF